MRREGERPPLNSTRKAASMDIAEKRAAGVPVTQDEHEVGDPFRVMLLDAMKKLNMNQKQLADAMSYTPQYVCDLVQGRRLGSVEFVERMCGLLRCRQPTRLKWHRAGARAHGWDV